MLKRSVAAFRRWFSTDHLPPNQDDKICAERRGFFKKAAVGAVSITGTAGLAKVVVDSVPQPDMRDKYIQDSRAGEQELSEREYVLMSEQEKADMVQSFIDQYSKLG